MTVLSVSCIFAYMYIYVCVKLTHKPIEMVALLIKHSVSYDSRTAVLIYAWFLQFVNPLKSMIHTLIYNCLFIFCRKHRSQRNSRVPWKNSHVGTCRGRSMRKFLSSIIIYAFQPMLLVLSASAIFVQYIAACTFNARFVVPGYEIRLSFS